MSNRKVWSLGDTNKSFKFISPILGLDREGTRLKQIEFDNFFQNDSRPELNNFLNCFIGDDANSIEDKVLLLYKFSGTRPFLEFEEWMSTHPLYEGTYDPDRTHVMFVFGIPDKVKPDVEHIKKGEYSKMSKEYLDLCISFFCHEHAVKEGRSSIYNIVTKAEQAYLDLETHLRKVGAFGPTDRVPREMEACSLMYRKEEYYQPEYVVRSALKGDYDNV